MAENAAGSFLFPPLDFASAEDYLQFWETVPISDRVLSNLVTTYRQNRERWIGEKLDEWAEKRDHDPKYQAWLDSKHATVTAISVEHEKARQEEIARLTAERPEKEINPISARGIAQAAQMYQYSAPFVGEDEKTIENHLIRWSRGNAPLTVKELWEHYHLDEIVDTAFVDQDAGVLRELAELRRHLGAQDIIN